MLIVTKKYSIIKCFKISFKNAGGRNNKGHLTAFNKGGGIFHKLRIVSYKRQLNIFAFFIRYEYDFFKKRFLALICYENGYLSYILGISDLKQSKRIIFSTILTNIFRSGNVLLLKNIFLGQKIICIEAFPMQGGKFIRSSGNFAVIVKQLQQNYSVLKLASKELRLFKSTCAATIGFLLPKFNYLKMLTSKRKAGLSRLQNKRPKVRGVAKNPVDHPHGGGEGKTSGGRPSCSPWGKLTKGVKTRSKKKKNFIFKVKKKFIE